MGRGAFMKIGQNSIVKTIKVKGKVYKVQANRNYGICDMEPRINEVFTDFQGRQINNPTVFHSLINALKDETKY